MQQHLIEILMYMNDSRLRNYCVKICQSKKCYDVSCNNCPLFHEPDYLFALDSLRGVINE